MKPYGHSRFFKQTSEYGCCTNKGGRHKLSRNIVDRSRRKTARQEGKMFTKLLTEEPIPVIITT